MHKTPEGRLKEDVKKLLEASGFYVRSIVIGQVPGMRNPSRGIPDLVCIKRSRTLWLELKSEKGKLRPEQEQFILEWTQKGGEAYVVRSLEDVMKILKGLGLDEPLRMTSGWRT